MEGLGFLAELLLLVVGTVLVLDGLPELSLKDDEFVEGLVFLLLNITIELMEFPQLF